MPATPRPTSTPTFWSAALLCLATVVMLTGIYPPFYLWPLAFLALVPFGVCVLGRPLKMRWLGFYYLTGALFFVPNLFWLWPVTFWGTLVLSLYLALYFALFALVLHRMVVDLRVPATLALPVAWTAVEFVRGTFLEGGFPWFTTGNAFAANHSFLGGLSTMFLQSADLLGVWGLTFLVGTVNGFVLDLLRWPLVNPKTKKMNPALRNMGIYAGMMVVGSLAYGEFRLHQTAAVTRRGPRIGVVQENIEQKLKDDPANFVKHFEEHLELTRELIAREKPDLVAWPETMVPWAFNREWMAFAADPTVLNDDGQEHLKKSVEAYAKLRAISDETGTYLLLGEGSQELHRVEPTEMKNTAALLAPRRGEVARYVKIHLVPFGEYIPFAGKGTWLRRVLQKLTPMDYDYSLVPGTESTRMALTTGDGRTFHFCSPICFEDVMPGPAREMAAVLADGSKRAEFLVNVSNDGWFFSAELDQHLQASQLRAVENRVPIARSVNTGNSAIIDSCGRIVELLPPRAVGSMSRVLELDSRVTLYARVGNLLPIVCGITAVLAVGWTLVRPRRGKKGV
jgi:apolipoprotein N-acyltransferase